MSFSQEVLRMFPVPRLIALRGTGLEISDHSVKFLTLKRASSGEVPCFSIASFGSEPIPRGAILGGEIQDRGAVLRALSIVREKIGQPFVHVSLPEQRGYVFQSTFPKNAELSVRDAVAFRLEERIPFSAAEAIFDYEVLPEASQDIRVNVTAFPRKIVEVEYETLVDAGFTPLSFEMESQAAARALLPKDDTTRMIVDFGDTRTSVSIADRGIVRFTTSLEIAGTSLETALEKSLGVAPAEADRLKNEEGILAASRGNTVAEALISTVSALRDEISRRFMYWNTHATEENREERPIQEILIIGGNANLRGLPEYLAQTMRVPVFLPNVWRRVCPVPGFLPPIPRNESFRYATVVGLALRGFEKTL